MAKDKDTRRNSEKPGHCSKCGTPLTCPECNDAVQQAKEREHFMAPSETSKHIKTAIAAAR